MAYAERNPNTVHGADIVIEPTAYGYNIWHDDRLLANMTREGRRYIFNRIAMQQASVYDIETNQFISGTLAQLTQEN